MVKTIITEPELRRFRLQMNLPDIGIDGQEKLKNTRVAVIGAGGTGAGVLQYLSSAGVSHLAIIDNGLVDEHSMQRQTLYGVEDLGKLKTIISRQRLQTLYPSINYEIINLQLDKSNINRIIEPFDLIIDASNNLQTNIIINDSCIKLNKPWIFSSVSGIFVFLSVFNFLNGPSLKCCTQKFEYNPEISLSVSYGIAAIFTSIECIKATINQKDILNGKLLKYNILNYTSEIISISRNENNFR